MPRQYTAQQKKHNLERQNEYNKQKYTKVCVSLHQENERYLIEALQNAPQGKIAYVRRLIREDIARGAQQ